MRAVLKPLGHRPLPFAPLGDLKVAGQWTATRLEEEEFGSRPCCAMFRALKTAVFAETAQFSSSSARGVVVDLRV